MLKPNYHDGSIVNLMSSLTLGLGGTPGPYRPLPLLPPEIIAEADHVVLWVIDGLGHRYLQRHGDLFKRYLHGSMTSVFPTSTAPAITTFLTGVAPQQHGVTGWFMNLKELGTVTLILPFQPRWGKVALNGDVSALLGYSVVFDRLPVRSYFVIHRSLVDSAYSTAGAGGAIRLGYRSLRDCLNLLIETLTGRRERSYIYAYWSLFDSLCHEHGVGSATALNHLRELEAAFGFLLQALAGSNTLLIITADHGFIDTTPTYTTRLERHPELAACLSMPLCGELRAIYCHLRPGKISFFENSVRERLGNHYALYPSEELIQQGWFGLGEPDPRLSERIGDYTLLPQGQHILTDSLPGEKPWNQVGVHGGLSAQELYVPLVLAWC